MKCETLISIFSIHIYNSFENLLSCTVVVVKWLDIVSGLNDAIKTFKLLSYFQHLLCLVQQET